MCARTLMVGCAAGEGHLDGDESSQFANAELLARSLPQLARELNCAMIVLKEFPAKYRAPLQCLRHAGFARVPSMPMTTLSIDYKDFEDYLSNMLSPRYARKSPAKVARCRARAAGDHYERRGRRDRGHRRKSIRFTKRSSNVRRCSSRNSPGNSCAKSGAVCPTRFGFSFGARITSIIAFGLMHGAGRRHLARICGI